MSKDEERFARVLAVVARKYGVTRIERATVRKANDLLAERRTPRPVRVARAPKQPEHFRLEIGHRAGQIPRGEAGVRKGGQSIRIET